MRARSCGGEVKKPNKLTTLFMGDPSHPLFDWQLLSPAMTKPG